jgi:[ribosomal protein S5]-alanine N-acetyltransferase
MSKVPSLPYAKIIAALERDQWIVVRQRGSHIRLEKALPNETLKIDDLLEVLSNPEAMQFYKQPFDRKMTQLWVERNIQRYAQDGFGLWAITAKVSGNLVGDCGLVLQEVDGVESVEIGYHVRRDLWGQGLATEAARASLQYGFSQLGCDELISLIHPANIASRRFAEKNGLRLIKEVEWRDTPTCMYAIERTHQEKLALPQNRGVGG